MSRERCQELMEIYLHEVLGKRQFDLITQIAGPDMKDSTLPHLRGPQALTAHAEGFCANTPDVEIEVVNIMATENSVVGIWQWSGQPKVPSGVSKSGAPVVPRLVCSVFAVQDGKISDYQVFVDAAEVFTQFAK